MTVNELKRAFLDERPVAFGGITYQKIEELNERVKSLIADMEEIGARPAYLRGGSYNDYLEYGRLKDLIAKECIEAFKAGFRFGKEATP